MSLAEALRAIEQTQARHLDHDPIRFPRRYPAPEDQEVVGLLAAALAFGRVKAFLPVLEDLFDVLGPSPAQALRDQSFPTEWLERFQYRWIHAADLRAALQAIGEVLREEGSLGALVQPEPDERHLAPALGRMARSLLGRVEMPSRGVKHLLVDPSRNSAAKRMHLYARWMVRTGAPDLGTWSHLDPSLLLIPLDTHVFRIASLLGLTARRQADRRAAEEVTAALRVIDPSDPVRFDFALAHVGISEGCRGEHVPRICGGCELRRVCRHGGVKEIPCG